MAIKTILVEDNAQIRSQLIPTMQEMAWIDVVAIAETQADAIRAAQQHDDWQLMVIDLFLREGSGLGVLRQLTGRRPGQVALVLTNYPTSDVRRRCMECEADGFFDKSIELDAFFERCLTLPGGRFPGRS
ncbi:MAG: response regulator [Variovorax sp.]|nr:MAG: response regulator [Variovorax sp.]